MSTPNFVHDLVEMAKAVESLPKVQQELQAYQDASLRDGQTIVRLELKLKERSTEMETLQARIRELEVARDDAEMKFLEADDRISAFKKLVGTFQNDTANLVKSMEPVVPEPVVAEPVLTSGHDNTTLPTGQGEAHPTTSPIDTVAVSGGASGQSEVPPAVNIATSLPDTSTLVGGGVGTQPAESGSNVSESPEVAQANPIASTPPASPSPSASTAFAEDPGTVHIATEEPKGKYWGKLYRDVPGFVSLVDWIANGGTERDYHAMSRY